MFDMGFWELMVIGTISLVVLGPERLPVAIRTVKGWITTVKKLSESVKSEITEELRINELHSHLKKAEQLDMSNLSPDLAKSVQSLKDAAEEVTRPYENKFKPLNKNISSTNHSKNSLYDSADNTSHSAAPVIFDGQVEQNDSDEKNIVDNTLSSKTSLTEIKNEDKYTHD